MKASECVDTVTIWDDFLESEKINSCNTSLAVLTQRMAQRIKLDMDTKVTCDRKKLPKHVNIPKKALKNEFLINESTSLEYTKIYSHCDFKISEPKDVSCLVFNFLYLFFLFFLFFFLNLTLCFVACCVCVCVCCV